MVTPVSDSQNQNYQNALDAYEQKKSDLLNQYSDLLQSNAKNIVLRKNTSNLFRTIKKSKNKIDVRAFKNVLYVDTVNLIAEIEGMATYEHIVNETLKYGYLPTVVPELKSITIGGALAGVGIESSSFRYGLVHETILEYEILLGDGRVVLCRPDNEHKALYYAFPNTYGTLGYALKVKVKLIPAKKYIKLTHVQFSNSKSYFDKLKKICQENRKSTSTISYIDGVIFHKNDLYITLGEFVDNVPYTSNYKYLNIFYKSLKIKKTDYLTTIDYIWRWDSDWFWCSKHFFMQNRLLRLIFGKFMLNSKIYWKIKNFFNKNKLARYVVSRILGPTESVIQDIEVPIEKSESFLIFFQKEIPIKPIWICPIMPYQIDVQYNFYKMDPNTLYINFGFWDFMPTNKPDGFYNKKIELKVQELEGNKSLYSSVYYKPEEFWTIYEKDLYLRLKKEYDPYNNLKDLYAKCTDKNLI